MEIGKSVVGFPQLRIENGGKRLFITLFNNVHNDVKALVHVTSVKMPGTLDPFKIKNQGDVEERLASIKSLSWIEPIEARECERFLDKVIF